ncbi:NaeI family type II restriction endonuclease [Kitasatospora sp. NPDC088861]|uniref:NaeI family type II restriction endonuclease n=1 Tax=Kitasatospora sp. NPDC088861 TaxID=3364078 RepID=UPI003816E495
MLEPFAHGLDVAWKFSFSSRGWTFPSEAVGHICLMLWAGDRMPRWSTGPSRENSLDLTNNQNLPVNRALASHGRLGAA